MLVSCADLQLVNDPKIGAAHIGLVKAWPNGTDETSKGKLRNECLSVAWFEFRADAAPLIIEAWNRHHNAVRPNFSLGYRTPREYTATPSNKHQPEA
ncbi:integrase core domain-containing protein [Algiphilus sp. NNCM1]|nr:integrase core domain-containing protein [Algiphilus acroporae]MCI5044792.1 transposase [Aquisalinus sp.]